MATQPKLVNKQFNSPIGLYSKQNVQEVLDRESQILANGVVGINFQNPDVGKPANLKNSAVLRMLEEEENRQRNGYGPGSDRLARPLRENVSWPPPEYEHKNNLRSTFKDVVIPGSKRVAWPPPNESGPDSPYVEQNAVASQGGPQYPAQSAGLQQNNQQAPPQQQSVSHTPVQTNQRPLRPLDVSIGSSSPLASPLLNQSPQGFRPATPSKGWAPVHSPVLTPTQPSWQQPSSQQQSVYHQTAHQTVSQQTYLGQQYQASPQQYQAPPQQYQAPPQQNQAPPQQKQVAPQQYQAAPQQNQVAPQQYQAPSQQNQASPQQFKAPTQQNQASPQQFKAPTQQNQAFPQKFSPQPAAAPSQVAPRVQQSGPAAKQVEPPPTTITLRSQAPVSQAPAPLVTSQPATATFKGGKHLRGDLKWPPEDVRERMTEEKRQLLELAKGPAFRPPRPNKDYTGFFAQHALNSTYPGYKIPPGTQFFRPE